MKHYVEIFGKGKETIIFLPGTGWTGNFGMPIASALNEKFTMHMIDLPGIGRSEGLDGVVKMVDAANWLNDYLEEKEIHKINIIGHSLGGGIGLSFAYYYPEKVNKLILLDIGFAKIERFPVQMFGSVGYFLPLISVLHRIFGQKYLGNETKESQNIESKEITDEEMKARIKSLGLEDSEFMRNAIANQPASSLKGLSLLLALYRFNMPRILNKLKVPCLVLYGNRKESNVKVQNKIKRQVSRIKHSNISMKELNGGHYAHVSDVRAFDFINSFLN
ncbi:alpha/beta hydrolase [Bacillus sp. APMAM]|nr:alpha/beta hydrolase [Bacillus sp. APMAM]RTZ54553.1 alpha/beta hydrolase [Bacillus sp. SAJ1]